MMPLSQAWQKAYCLPLHTHLPTLSSAASELCSSVRPSVGPRAWMRGPGAFSLRAALSLAGPDALGPSREPRRAAQPARPGGGGGARQGPPGQGRARRAAPPRGAGGLRPQPERLSPAHREKPLEGLCDPVKFSEGIKTSKGLGGAPAHFVPRRGKLGARRGQGRAGPARGRRRSEDPQPRAARRGAAGPWGAATRPSARGSRCAPAGRSCAGRALTPARRGGGRGPSAPGPGGVRLPPSAPAAPQPPRAVLPGEPVRSGRQESSGPARRAGSPPPSRRHTARGSLICRRRSGRRQRGCSGGRAGTCRCRLKRFPLGSRRGVHFPGLWLRRPCGFCPRGTAGGRMEPHRRSQRCCWGRHRLSPSWEALLLAVPMNGFLLQLPGPRSLTSLRVLTLIFLCWSFLKAFTLPQTPAVSAFHRVQKSWKQRVCMIHKMILQLGNVSRSHVIPNWKAAALCCMSIELHWTQRDIRKAFWVLGLLSCLSRKMNHITQKGLRRGKDDG